MWGQASGRIGFGVVVTVRARTAGGSIASGWGTQSRFAPPRRRRARWGWSATGGGGSAGGRHRWPCRRPECRLRA
eukprot:7346630-Prymnesium_polylepis.1